MQQEEKDPRLFPGCYLYAILYNKAIKPASENVIKCLCKYFTIVISNFLLIVMGLDQI